MWEKEKKCIKVARVTGGEFLVSMALIHKRTGKRVCKRRGSF